MSLFHARKTNMFAFRKLDRVNSLPSSTTNSLGWCAHYRNTQATSETERKKKRWKKPTKIAFVSCDRLVNNHCKLLNTVQYSFKNEWNQTQNLHIM